MALRTVTITVDPTTGDFSYSPGVLHAAPGDQIEFFADGDFVVSFERSPLNHAEIYGAPNEGPPNFKAGPVSVRTGVEPGRYAYALAVCVDTEDGSRKVFIDHHCPQVVVE